jgi:hypothetical protein
MGRPFVDFNIPLNNSKLTFAKWGILYGIIEYYDGIIGIMPLRRSFGAPRSLKTA